MPTRLSALVLIPAAVILLFGGAASALDHDEAIRRVAAATFELDTMWYQIEVLSSQLDTAELDEAELSLRAISQKEPLGLFSVMATVRRGQQTVAHGQVSLRIRRFAEVLVTNDKLARHEAPSADEFSLRRMEITSVHEQPITTFEALGGFRMRRNLAKDQILTSSALEAAPDIDVGQEVSIRCSNGAFTVTATGTAQQDGRVGETIRIKNRASNKIVNARILDGATVAVEP